MSPSFGSRSAACKPRGIGLDERDLASKEPTSVEGIGQRGGSSNANRFGSMGPREWPSQSPRVLRGRIRTRSSKLHPLPKAMKLTTRPKAFRSAEARALNRVRGASLLVVEVNAKARYRCRKTTGVCAQRSSGRMEPRERASAATWNVRDRVRFERRSSSAPSSARRVGECESNPKPRKSRLSRSFEATLVEADDGE